MFINGFVGPWGIASDYGWFHVYAFTMFLGMALAVFFSWYRLYSQKIPTDGLIWSVIFIIPASLLGASFFGKNDPTQPINFWARFAFWKPGMSIHGGVLIGAIVGLIFFGILGRKTKISLWVYSDCIIPNILLGQVIGRWGNFFNHELLGAIVGYSPIDNLSGSGIAAISWLPAFIRDNCFQLIGGSPETAFINGQQMYVFRAPIFLYESIANLGFWVILTFLLPNGFRWMSKKPWKVEKNKYHLLTMTDIARKNKNNKIKNYFTLIHKNHKLKRKYWNQAFYHDKPDSVVIRDLNHKYKLKKERVEKENFFIKNNLISKAYFSRSKKLYHLNNPKGYFVMRSGVQMSLYFFGWNLIRFCLELQRDDATLFLKHQRVLDYIVLITIFTLGLIFAFLSQFVFARYCRQSGWTYEKEY